MVSGRQSYDGWPETRLVALAEGTGDRPRSAWYMAGYPCDSIMTLYSGDEFYGDDITSPDGDEDMTPEQWRQQEERDAAEYEARAEARDRFRESATNRFRESKEELARWREEEEPKL